MIQVRGFADQDPRDKEHPEAASNRRISVIVRYQNVPDEPDAADDNRRRKSRESRSRRITRNDPCRGSGAYILKP